MSINIFDVISGLSSDNLLIPYRDPNFITGSTFVQNNMNLTGAVREQNILKEFLQGNIPDFLKKMIPIIVTNGNDSITYLVMPDFLSIGSNVDYVRMPMNPLSAQKIADTFDCTLPTCKMVNDIYKASINKLAPLPWGPPYDSDMEKTHRIGTHNQRIQNQLVGKNPYALTSGHKKDIVLTNKLYPKNPSKKVAIYGWIQLNNKPIQELNSTNHEDTYEDYSHGIRLIANDVVVNGNIMRIQDIFKDAKLSNLLSNEGPLQFLRY